MIDSYNDSTGSRKKFLIPLVVLLLCAVSLTGAGYAYNANVTNIDNGADVDGISLALYQNDGTTPVNAAMYTVTDINIATHTTNGYALKYGGYGFTTEASQAAGQSHEGKVVDVQGTSALDTFETGFYVEAYKGETPAGYHATEPTINSTETLAAAIAAGKNVGLFSLGDTYVLTVDNQTGGNIDLKINTQLAAAYATPSPVKAIYVVITAEDGTTYVAKDTAATDSEYTAIVSGLQAAGETTYTVNAYVVLSDFHSENVPAAAAYSDISFTVSFTAAPSA